MLDKRKQRKTWDLVMESIRQERLGRPPKPSLFDIWYIRHTNWQHFLIRKQITPCHLWGSYTGHIGLPEAVTNIWPNFCNDYPIASKWKEVWCCGPDTILRPFLVLQSAWPNLWRSTVDPGVWKPRCKVKALDDWTSSRPFCFCTLRPVQVPSSFS